MTLLDLQNCISQLEDTQRIHREKRRDLAEVRSRDAQLKRIIEGDAEVELA